MKISKLFHWLYAILMLLPVFFIGSRCFYVILNKNAKDSYYGETINERIDTYYTFDELELNDTYNLNTPIITSFNEVGNSNEDLIAVENVILNGVEYSNAKKARLYYTNVYATLYLWDNSNQVVTAVSLTQQTNTFVFTYMGKITTSVDYWSMFDNYYYTISYNEYSYLDNAFEYSINSLNEVQLFSWAQTSFLSAPMVYITGLFGMPSNSPVITLLSYWLSISIVWLVFDLVMYIPLLVHRWIDRGIIE